MKTFKKKHSAIPSLAVIQRLMQKEGLADKYNRAYQHNTSTVFPEPIRASCLPRFDSGRRTHIQYYPDLHNFKIFDEPNRSLPIPKFLALFRNYVSQDTLQNIEHELTNYRLEFFTEPDDWLRVYADDSVESCMTNSRMVACYAHPENKLALAALYAPGSDTLVARTIVNTEEKWYVRLFGDPLLTDRLRERGYIRLNKTPAEFKMYGIIENGHIHRDNLRVPYFDFPCMNTTLLENTYNPNSNRIEIIVNEGFS